VDAQRLFLEKLNTIDRIVRAVVERHRLPRQDRDDFSSHVRLRLIEHDYRILRAFQGRSSLHTYLTAVITRLFLDYQNQRWGRWRPSEMAVRLGPEAVLLERLVTRDEYTVDEAIRILGTRPEVTIGERDLRAIWERLPRRRRSREAEGPAAEPASRAGRSEDEVAEADEAQRIAAELTRLFENLPAADRVLVHLHFGHGVPLAILAGRFGQSRSAVQRRMAHLMGEWRRRLTAAGVDHDAVRIAATSGDPALSGLLERLGESLGGHGRLETQDE
jgi:RNA polymerase sigma factor for flagellar operon FliA